MSKEEVIMPDFSNNKKSLDEVLAEYKKSRLNIYIRDLKNVSTAREGIDLIQKEIASFSDFEIKRMLNVVACAITPKIEALALSEEPNEITDTKEYCTIELNRTLTQNDWDFFEKYSVSPIVSKTIPLDSSVSHSLLIEWLSSQMSEKMVRKKKYDEYLEKYPLKREEAKIRSDLKTVQNEISIIQTRERSVILFFLILGILLVIVSGICLIAAKDASLVIWAIICTGIAFVLFRYIYKATKKLMSLQNEEETLSAKITEIENLPPFIEDDAKRNDAEIKVEAVRVEHNRQAGQTRISVEKATKKLKWIIACSATVFLALIICVRFLTQPPVPSSTAKNVRTIHNIYMKEKLDDYSKKTLYNFGLNVPGSLSFDDKQWNGTWVVTEDFVKEYIETYSAEEFIGVYQKYIVSYIEDTHRSSADLEFFNSNPQLLDYISNTTRLLFEMPELFEVVNYNPATDEVLKETSKTETVSGRFNSGSDNHIERRESELTIDTYYYSGYYVEHRHGFEYDEGELGWSNGKFHDVPASFVPVDEYRLCLNGSSGFVSRGKSLKDLNLKWVSIGTEKYYERVIYEIRVGTSTYHYPKRVYILTTNMYESGDYYIFYGS